MANITPDDIDLFKKTLNESHLQQLSGLTLVADPLEKLPRADYGDLVQWTNDSQTQITNGYANRVYGGPFGSPIDWDSSFLAFMESAAMYLRDTSKVLQAVESYRSGSNEDAQRLLEESTAAIDKLAAMWNMRFIQICDFVEQHPDGHSYIVGPFCGAFVCEPLTGLSPFIGIAFKGTNVTREVLNDLMAATTLRPSGRLWETEVSQGFYYPLFSTYNQDPMKLPFLMIQKAIQTIVAKADTTVITHVTGHSLGAAYASLTYGELCIEGFGTLNAALGDMYTFGSPRVGRGDFSSKVKASLLPPISNGTTWRIVNNKDYVPQVPASPPWPISTDPFVHLDSAYTIYADTDPLALPTEIGTNPTWSIPTAISPHYTTEYYKSLTYATTEAAPLNSVPILTNSPLAVSTLSNTSYPTSIGTTSSCTPDISLNTAQGGSIVGTITYDRFVGEITAVGTLEGGSASLTGSPTFYYDASTSWRKLYSKENQCIFTINTSTNSLKIDFIVDGAQVAWATVAAAPASDRIAKGSITRGSCIWTFKETEDTNNVMNQIIVNAASLT